MRCESVGCVGREDRVGSAVAHAVVEYIRQFEFCFDVADVEEDLDGVLHYYGIYLELSVAERRLVAEGLRRYAEGFEFAEVERLVFQEEEELLLL